jgi:single-stranded-DNA-specific exonuclease
LSESDRKTLSLYDPTLQELLFNRGITNIDDAEKFLRPNYEKDIHDPYLFKDMDKAVKRILKAFDKKEKIAIFSDYDADGIPGAVVFSDFFRKIGYENFVVYIPHRNDEGYGMNKEALEMLAKDGATLVITIDCGISNHDEVDTANTLGMDVIITDHHLPKTDLPKAFAIINHKQIDCEYPDKNLCGSGVIWKLITAIIQNKKFQEKYNTDKEGNKIVQNGYEKWLLDLVGLATLSDMVPLVGENRVIASYGLVVMRKSPRPGLHKLFSLLKVRQNEITEDDIGFLITPRINAASRMGHPKDAYDMLSSTDVTEAGVLAEHLNKINDERKGVVGSMVRDIKKTISLREDALRNVIVLGNPEWKPSLLGLVANSFSDEHNRPVFLWGRDTGSSTVPMIKGSCRSGGDVNIYKLMEHASDILTEYGGHKQAGGFSIIQDHIHLLEGRLNTAFDELVKQGNEDEPIYIDKVLKIEDVDWRLYTHIEKLAPFGIENPKPLFQFENAEIVSSKQFGKEKNHLEITFKNSRGRAVQAIAFFSHGDKFSADLSAGKKINLIAHVEKSTFRNFPELRLRIVDIV